MNKSKLFFILIILFTSTVKSQNFEGVLNYAVNIEISEKMKAMGLTKEELINKMKKEKSFSENINYYFKEDNYMIEMVNVETTSKYIGQKNTIYTREKNNDLIVAIDASIDLENLMFGTSPKIENIETDSIIFDKKCSKVIVTWKTGVYEYYYNSDILKMNPKLYSNHKYDMWSEFLKISKSLPLKIIKRVNGMMTIEMNLINYEEREIDSKKFKLPELKLEKKLSKYVPTKNQTIYKVIFSKEEKQEQENKAHYKSMREALFSIKSKHLDIQILDKNKVYGIICETTRNNFNETLGAYVNGNAKFYSSSGEHNSFNLDEELKKVIKEFVLNGQRYIELSTKIESSELPKGEILNFYFLTENGIYLISQSSNETESDKSNLYNLYSEVNNIIAQIKLKSKN